MSKKILVTGGTGYIGSHTIVDLISHGYEVICLDNGINSDKSSLFGIYQITGHHVHHYDVDACNLDEVKKIFKDHPDIEGIIHFAALKSVEESVEKPLLYFRNNLTSLINVLEVGMEYKIKAFIFSSSCTVYGDVQFSPVNEATPLQDAASPYGRTKQIGEKIIMDSVQNTATKSILLRYFNPAGAHSSGKLGESPLNSPVNLVPVITAAALGKRKLTVFGADYPTKDGSCVRDYIHVEDLARAHTLALEYIFQNKQTISTEVFNVGIGNGLTVLEMIQAFERVSGIKLEYNLGKRRSGDVMAIYSDYKKASDLLAWSPKFDVDQIMLSAWQWEKSRL